MRRPVRNGLAVAGMVGGFFLLGQAVASADDDVAPDSTTTAPADAVATDTTATDTTATDTAKAAVAEVVTPQDEYVPPQDEYVPPPENSYESETPVVTTTDDSGYDQSTDDAVVDTPSSDYTPPPVYTDDQPIDEGGD